MNHRELKALIEATNGVSLCIAAYVTVESYLEEKEPDWVYFEASDVSAPYEDPTEAIMCRGRIKYIGDFKGHHMLQLEHIDDEECIVGRHVIEADPHTILALIYA